MDIWTLFLGISTAFGVGEAKVILMVEWFKEQAG